MNAKIFNSLNTDEHFYFYLATGNKSKDDVLKYLKDNGKRNTTASDHVKKATDGQLPYITCVDENLVLDKDGIATFIKELSDQKWRWQMKLKSRIALCLGLALGIIFIFHTTAFADDVGYTGGTGQ